MELHDISDALSQGDRREKQFIFTVKQKFEDICSQNGMEVTVSDPFKTVPFNKPTGGSPWQIDLVIEHLGQKIACEGKFKAQRDVAHPNNRGRVYNDLYKCEIYMRSGEYQKALFFWLTDDISYLKPRSIEKYSTHQDVKYLKGTILPEWRESIVTPFLLQNNYEFKWKHFIQGWYLTGFIIENNGSLPLF
ncbi:MAG: hypothetical protein PHY28_01805 [Dehalococcoidales bacterium]|nr:hypothetical protein [Dehalococcoidales bacterium]